MKSRFKFRTMVPDDVPQLLMLAECEGWISDPWEFEMLLSSFPEGCLCCDNQDHQPVGFITAMHHNRSGWIGNLIIKEEFRRRRIGKRLFKNALNALYGIGAETFWLTASQAGQPLYQKQGFNVIDSITRWRRKGLGTDNISRTSGTPKPDQRLDELTWGDSRELLLKKVTGRGRGIANGASFAIIQPCRSAWQIGPFSAEAPGQAEVILAKCLTQISSNDDLFLDAPRGNAPFTELLKKYAFTATGTTSLMSAGKQPEYRPDLLCSLATLGSCG